MNIKRIACVAAGIVLANVAAFGQGLDLKGLAEELELKGDLRVRYERRDRDATPDNEVRDRMRTRFRLGMSFKTANGWDVKAGLATGGADPTSTNDTWSDNADFETGDIRLDYAYAVHKFGDNVELAFGQQKSPYTNAGISMDSDARPTGVSVMASDLGPAFVTAGAYKVRYNGSDQSWGNLFAVQGGVKVEGDVGMTGALGYYRYNSAVVDNVGGLGEDYQFHIVDLYGDINFKLGDVGKLKFYGEFAQNMGADGNVGEGQQGGTIDPEDNNQHFILGGQAKISKVKFSLDYVVVEADSLYNALKDADFGTGVANSDIEGFRAKFSYSVTKNFSIGATYMAYERIEEENTAHDDAELIQIDFKYKF